VIQTTRRISDAAWCSWIPTNAGELHKNFIGDTETLQKSFKKSTIKTSLSDFDSQIIEVSDIEISDIKCFFQNIILFFKQESLKASGSIFFNQRKNDFFQEDTGFIASGTITINHENIIAISSQFTLHKTGLVILSSLEYEYDSEQANDTLPDEDTIEVIVNSLYNFLKKVVHGDNHHSAKVDTIIGVHKLSENIEIDNIINNLNTTNNTNTILEECKISNIEKQFSQTIKLKEREIKTENKSRCNNWLMQLNLHIELQGYMSYYRTFISLFYKKKKRDEKIKSMENVIDSSEAAINKISLLIENRKSYMGHTLSLIALMLTIVIISAKLSGVDFPFEETKDSTNITQYASFKLHTLYGSMFLVAFYLFLMRPFFCSIPINKVNSSCFLETIRLVKSFNPATQIILFVISLGVIFLLLNYVTLYILNIFL